MGGVENRPANAGNDCAAGRFITIRACGEPVRNPRISPGTGLRAELSPIIHRLSTAHPDAIVEMSWLIRSANEFSARIMVATFSHAYSTVV